MLQSVYPQPSLEPLHTPGPGPITPFKVSPDIVNYPLKDKTPTWQLKNSAF